MVLYAEGESPKLPRSMRSDGRSRMTSAREICGISLRDPAFNSRTGQRRRRLRNPAGLRQRQLFGGFHLPVDRLAWPTRRVTCGLRILRHRRPSLKVCSQESSIFSRRPNPVLFPKTRSAVAGPVPKTFSCRLLRQIPHRMTGGVVRIADSTTFAASKTIAAALVELEPGALRDCISIRTPTNGNTTSKGKAA
jgi:hypothetical protein